MTSTVRAYLPSTMATLAELADRGALTPGPAYTVTPWLRELVAEPAGGGRDPDPEELEYAAFRLAADASLELLRADPAPPRRRVVVSVDAPAEPLPDGRVRLVEPVPLRAVAAIHVDDRATEPTVAAALSDGTDVDDELSWYDVSELGQLLA